MLYNENLREEEQHLIQQIAEQTERGKIDWELTEYNPLSFLNEDKIDKNPAVICQSFSFEAIIGGSRYELDVMENIDVPSGMGDYTITLMRDETENYLKIEDALSFDCDRYECTPPPFGFSHSIRYPVKQDRAAANFGLQPLSACRKGFPPR